MPPCNHHHTPPHLLHSPRHLGPQLQLEVVHWDVVQHAVRPGKVDVLKDAWIKSGLGTLVADQLALGCNDYELTRAHIPDSRKAQGAKGTRLGGNAPVLA